MSAREGGTRGIRRLQHRAAVALGVDEGDRAVTVSTMLMNNRRRAPGYWIQLVLATGIATFGLVLSSTAVVIGAMLVSPLMGPIVELGMGFAVGSSFLVIRAALRVLLSVCVVVAGAAAITVLLPFHEVTAEVSARAAPTALDLLVAIFCALTAAYTAVRRTSDTTSAAAGTAIGIALVPPLCVTGFGIGTGQPSIAGGAALLFTANLSAIFVFSIASFLVLGYDQVDAASVERELGVDGSTRADALAVLGQSALQRIFGSRYGVAMRFVIPIIFFTAVYLPLSRALREVTWEVRTRAALREIVSADAPRALQTSMSVERHTISLHLLVVTSAERATAIEAAMRGHVRTRTGVTPDITVTAVADASALAAATRVSAGTAPDRIDPSQVEERVASALRELWPRDEAGALVGWEFVIAPNVRPTIVPYHIGDSLGAAGRALLADAMSARLGSPLLMSDSALSNGTVTAGLGREAQLTPEVERRIAWMTRAPALVACVRGPFDSTRSRTAAQRRLDSTLAAAAAAHTVTRRDSSGWRMTVAPGTCGDSAAR